MSIKRFLAACCLVAPLLVSAGTLDTYGELTGKTVLAPSALPLLPDSVVSELPADKVKAIAALPSREQLIAQLLGTMLNPIVGFARVLNGPVEAFARTVQAVADQKAAA